MSCLFVWNNLAAQADTSSAPALGDSWANAWQPDLTSVFDTERTSLRWGGNGSTNPDGGFKLFTDWPQAGYFLISVPTTQSPMTCIAAHNLAGVLVRAGSGTLASIGNVAINVRAYAYTARGGNDVQMGYLMLTTASGRLVMPHGLAAPFTRPSHANRHKIVHATNDGAALIGRTLQQQHFRTTLHFNHLPMAWYDANFAPMLEYWKSQPVFFRWHEDYPVDDCMLWLEAKGGKFPEPRLGKGLLVSISLAVVGYV